MDLVRDKAFIVLMILERVTEVHSSILETLPLSYPDVAWNGTVSLTGMHLTGDSFLINPEVHGLAPDHPPKLAVFRKP